MLLHIKSHFQEILAKMSNISGQFQFSGQFQDTFEISGISGQLGPLDMTQQTQRTLPAPTCYRLVADLSFTLRTYDK